MQKFVPNQPHCTILVNDQLDAHFFFYIFISVLCMFRATSRSSSGESIVSIQHLVSICVGDRLVRRSGRNFPTCTLDGQSDTYQMLYWYNWFSWWWARGCSKRAENWNKHTEKELCVKLVVCKNYTEMHGQQNLNSTFHNVASASYDITHCLLIAHAQFVSTFFQLYH
jgi:hypothetical protein